MHAPLGVEEQVLVVSGLLHQGRVHGVPRLPLFGHICKPVPDLGEGVGFSVLARSRNRVDKDGGGDAGESIVEAVLEFHELTSSCLLKPNWPSNKSSDWCRYVRRAIR
jgi:hypothetical protein